MKGDKMDTDLKAEMQTAMEASKKQAEAQQRAIMEFNRKAMFNLNITPDQKFILWLIGIVLTYSLLMVLSIPAMIGK
jgi:hypothetical protein